MTDGLACEVLVGSVRGAAGSSAPAALQVCEVWRPVSLSADPFAFALGVLAAGLPPETVRVRHRAGTVWRARGLQQHHARTLKRTSERVAEVAIWAGAGTAPYVEAGALLPDAQADQWTRYGSGMGSASWCHDWLAGWRWGLDQQGRQDQVAWVVRRTSGGWLVLTSQWQRLAEPPEAPLVEVQLWSSEERTWVSWPELTQPRTENQTDVGWALLCLGQTVRLAWRSGHHRTPTQPQGWAGDYGLAVPVNQSSWDQLLEQLPRQGQTLPEQSGRLWQPEQQWQRQQLPWRFLAKGLSSDGALTLLRVWSRWQGLRGQGSGQGGILLGLTCGGGWVVRSVEGQRGGLG